MSNTGGCDAPTESAFEKNVAGVAILAVVSD